MLSLRERQTRFAAALLEGGGDAGERIAIYRNTVCRNYRNALGATFAVVKQLVGAPFFNAAVDAYALAVPSTGGDLNVYGSDFPDFLASYPHARGLPYLADVARLEWAVDAAGRAADAAGSPEALLAALAKVPAEQVIAQRFALDPSCRFPAFGLSGTAHLAGPSAGFRRRRRRLVRRGGGPSGRATRSRRSEHRAVAAGRSRVAAHARRWRRPGDGAGCRGRRRTGIRPLGMALARMHRQSNALAIARRLKAFARSARLTVRVPTIRGAASMRSAVDVRARARRARVSEPGRVGRPAAAAVRIRAACLRRARVLPVRPYQTARLEHHAGAVPQRIPCAPAPARHRRGTGNRCGTRTAGPAAPGLRHPRRGRSRCSRSTSSPRLPIRNSRAAGLKDHILWGTLLLVSFLLRPRQTVRRPSARTKARRTRPD